MLLAADHSRSEPNRFASSSASHRPRSCAISATSFTAAPTPTIALPIARAASAA
jgi:hypothetical protein